MPATTNNTRDNKIPAKIFSIFFMACAPGMEKSRG
jgi:hypothetical protein